MDSPFLNTLSDKRAVVLLSGGMDSTTVLAWAIQQGYECVTLSVDYGHLYQAELTAARALSQALGAKKHQVVTVDLNRMGGSALLDADIPIPTSPTDEVPSTYVPARNTILLSLGLALAEVTASDHIFIGVNSVDFSGYPDCRADFIEAYEKLANLATQRARHHPIHIQAPLMNLSKAEIVMLGVELGVDFSQTVSCYQAQADGSACGCCDACRLRKAGFEEADIEDVTRYRNDGF